MQNITLIGIDLGKHSFHIHCQDKSGKALLRKKFTRTKLMGRLRFWRHVRPQLL